MGDFARAFVGALLDRCWKYSVRKLLARAVDCLSWNRTDGSMRAAERSGRMLGRGCRGDFGRGVALIMSAGDTSEDETSEAAAAAAPPAALVKGGFTAREVRLRRSRTGRGKCS